MRLRRASEGDRDSARTPAVPTAAGDRSPPRIAVLVLACATDPYDAMIRAIRRTWGARRVEGVDVFYVYGNVSSSRAAGEIARFTGAEPPRVDQGEIVRIGDVLIAGCADLISEQEDCLLWKRLLAFGHLTEAGSYDLIYTVCAASYVDVAQLVRNAVHSPAERAVSGSVSIDPAHSAPFVSGASMLLTVDVARELARRRTEIIDGNDYGFRDDLAIGRFVASELSSVPLADFVDDVVECRPLGRDHVFVGTGTGIDYVNKPRERHVPRPGAHQYHFGSRQPRDMVRFHRRHFDPRRHTVGRSRTRITNVQIFGERRSGTNYLAALVARNFAHVELTSAFGSKHWFIRDHHPRGHANRTTDWECVRTLDDSEDTLFLVIHRDPYDWLRSLHARPYHAPDHWVLPFPEFLRRPWRSVESERINPLWPESETGEYFIEEADHVVSLRTAKARHFLSLRDAVPHVEFLRYEDLAANPALLAGIADRHEIDTIHAEIHDEAVRLGEREALPFEARARAPIDLADVEFIRANLDWDVEAELGYRDTTERRGAVTRSRFELETDARLLVVLERDVGLFSMVEQVLHTLHMIDRHGSDRIPVVVMGRDIAYFDPDGHDGARTVWEYYFEPLVAEWPAERVLGTLGERALDLVASRRLAQERLRGLRDFPDQVHGLKGVPEPRHGVPALTPDDLANLRAIAEIPAAAAWQWTDDYTPTVDGVPFDGPPTPDDKARLLERWVRPRAALAAAVEEFHRTHLADHEVIGVHVRGTDFLVDAERPDELELRPFFDHVDARLRAAGSEPCRVLVASDDQFYVDAFRERYGDLCVAWDSERSGPADRLAGSGPTGKIMPGFLSGGGRRAVQNGADAVVEFNLLCRSGHVVHNAATMARLASCVVGGSTVVEIAG